VKEGIRKIGLEKIAATEALKIGITNVLYSTEVFTAVSARVE
jgi:hypothetical protein